MLERAVTKPYEPVLYLLYLHDGLKWGFVHERCLGKYTATACSGHVKLNWLSVNTIWQQPARVIISVQPQLMLLICGHLPVNHSKSSVFGVAFECLFEALPCDLVLSLQHALRVELIFFAVVFINNIVALRAESERDSFAPLCPPPSHLLCRPRVFGAPVP